tara:strand:- start:2590 stop:3129 length:540 start_codon:yes stop_codon:yes gene_type:complete
MIQQKYIFLDRDGVINIDSNEYIKTVDEWEPLPRSIEAIKRLSDNNYQIIIISNQSGIDRGLINPIDFIHINVKMLSMVNGAGGSIAAILYCPSLPSSKNPNRKPKPGMFLDIAERMNIKLSRCYAIGDSPRDIEASYAAKCKPIAVRTGNGAKIDDNNEYNVPIFDDLLDAVDFVLSQ